MPMLEIPEACRSFAVLRGDSATAVDDPQRQNEESTMISKMFRIALTIVLASFALGAVAWAKCSNSSVTGIYGYLGGGIDNDGTPTAILLQLTFDSSTGNFTATGTNSKDGVIESGSGTGTYTVASNCTATGTITFSGGTTKSFSFVVTSSGGLKEVDGNTGATSGGFALAQGSPTCTNAGLKGSFGFQATGVFVTGAPFTGPLDLIGKLALSVNKSGDGMITGEVAGSENGTILTFTEEPVTGSYSVSSDCTGTLSITPEGQSALNFSFAVVDGGKELMAIETDADTVSTAALQR
jgi:hypothetical protein